jgi:hypothetical protein
MFRFLIQKIKETPGPLKQTRIVLGDLTEEILDLAEYYWKQRRERDDEHGCGAWQVPPCHEDAGKKGAVEQVTHKSDPEPPLPARQEAAVVPKTPPKPQVKVEGKAKSGPASKKVARPKSQPAKSATSKAAAPKTIDSNSDVSPLEPMPRLAQAMTDPENLKKQDFKVLGILWDLEQRGMLGMNANDLSAHGERLGLVIRHENIRKVIRLRLSEYVETIRFLEDGASLYRYELTKAGVQYFEKTFLK